MRRSFVLPLLLLVLAVPALSLMLVRFDAFVPMEHWFAAMVDVDRASIEEIMLLHVLMPRSAMAIACGLALGLSGAIFQLVLDNPLAEPTTLGVSAGATLSTILSLAFFPSLAVHSELVAGAGAFMALTIVLALAFRARLSAPTLVLAGLLINLYCASAASIAVLFNHELLDSIFLWQAGSLHQNNWRGVRQLALTIPICVCLLGLIGRQLSSLMLGDASARSLGISPTFVRFQGLVLATALAAVTVAHVGMIGFIGLAAPAIARTANLRTIRRRVFAAAAIGTLLLWLADEIVQWASMFVGDLPTGAFTALLGAPILLVMIARRRNTGLVREEAHGLSKRHDRGIVWLLALAFIVMTIAIVAVLIGRPTGIWQVSLDPAILQWRWPRVLAAVSGGALLGSAGFVLQRITGNPLAGPEILGISSAAALGVALQLLLMAHPSVGPGGASAGAVIGLIAVFFWGRRGGSDPLKLLLVGVALNLLFGAILGLLLAIGHPRLRGMIAWLSGSTANITPETALTSTALTFVLVLAPLAFMRWLAVLPLGVPVARSLGLPVRNMNSILLLLAGLQTALSTTLLGPTTFLGLLAPALVRLTGLGGVGKQAIGCTLVGSMLALLADWLGRTLLFPWEIPAGLVVSFIAVPVMIFLLVRQGR